MAGPAPPSLNPLHPLYPLHPLHPLQPLGRRKHLSRMIRLERRPFEMSPLRQCSCPAATDSQPLCRTQAWSATSSSMARRLGTAPSMETSWWWRCSPKVSGKGEQPPWVRMTVTTRPRASPRVSPCPQVSPPGSTLCLFNENCVYSSCIM